MRNGNAADNAAEDAAEDAAVDARYAVMDFLGLYHLCIELVGIDGSLLDRIETALLVHLESDHYSTVCNYCTTVPYAFKLLGAKVLF